jgi:hypothetical protein
MPTRPAATVLRHQLEGELGSLPVVVDDRGDLLVAEGPHPVAELAFLVGQQVVDPVEIA